VLSGNTDKGDEAGINIVVAEDSTMGYLKGRIDIDSSPAVRDRLLAVLQDASHPKTLTLDLSAVTHIDSSGVATLIEALKVATRNKTELKLQGLHDRLHRLFESTGISSLFNRCIRR